MSTHQVPEHRFWTAQRRSDVQLKFIVLVYKMQHDVCEAHTTQTEVGIDLNRNTHHV